MKSSLRSTPSRNPGITIVSSAPRSALKKVEKPPDDFADLTGAEDLEFERGSSIATSNALQRFVEQTGVLDDLKKLSGSEKKRVISIMGSIDPISKADLKAGLENAKREVLFHEYGVLYRKKEDASEESTRRNREEFEAREMERKKKLASEDASLSYELGVGHKRPRLGRRAKSSSSSEEDEPEQQGLLSKVWDVISHGAAYQKNKKKHKLIMKLKAGVLVIGNNSSILGKRGVIAEVHSSGRSAKNRVVWHDGTEGVFFSRACVLRSQ